MSRTLCSKAVVNAKHGGFSLSETAIALLRSKHGVVCDGREITRNMAALVDVVETLGGEANGTYAALAVVPLRRGATYVIYEYDGMEWVAERHRVYDAATKRWRLPADATIVRTPAK